ncbi:MAG TPA: glycosyltransferase family A protein [Solirubrobacterales bacterium]|nr:glycosyltransferase family A protein [Solirubrobacterales bacterium]
MPEAADLVSVVIPTRNRWTLLSRALASVLAQEGVALEVLVVDDGSTDATADLGAEADERITYLRNDPALGVARARNRGIQEARGKWVAFLDDDDFWAPTKLRSQLLACAAEGAVFSYTGLVSVDPTLSRRKVSLPARSAGLERRLLAMNAIGSPSSVMVQRSVLEEVGGFDPAFSVLADWDLYIRIAASGKGALCEAPLTAYLNHATNMHLNADSALEEFRRLRVKHEALARSAGVTVGGKAWWEWLASALRRSGHRFRGAALFLWVAIRFGHPSSVARATGTLAGDKLSRGARKIWPSRTEQPDGSLPEANWVDAFVEERRSASRR